MKNIGRLFIFVAIAALSFLHCDPLLAQSPVVQQATESPAVQIVRDNRARAAHIQTLGTLYDGKQELGAGSGFLVGQQLVITRNHVIPPDENFKALSVLVRLSSRSANPRKVESWYRDPERDLAILRLAQPVSELTTTSVCPIRVMDKASLVEMGEDLYTLGYQVNLDLMILSGIVASKPEQGNWFTNTLFNPGISGAPIFDRRGILTGFAGGGITKFQLGDNTTFTNGVNFFIPSHHLLSSPLVKDMGGQFPPPECWTNASQVVRNPTYASTFTCYEAGGIRQCAEKETSESQFSTLGPDGNAKSFVVPTAILAPPIAFNRSFPIFRTGEFKPDQQPGQPFQIQAFEDSFNAEPGYIIEVCRFDPANQIQAQNIRCQVNPNHVSATLKYQLITRAVANANRALLQGTFTLRQQRR